MIHLNGTIVAHGAFSERVGTQSISIVFSQQKYDSIMDELLLNGYTWIDYVFENSTNNLVMHKKSYLSLEDDYIFGCSWFYTVESEYNPTLHNNNHK